MRRGGGLTQLLFFLNLILGAYFLNDSFEFIPMPKFIDTFSSWISLVAGILLILGAFIALSIRRRYY